MGSARAILTDHRKLMYPCARVNATLARRYSSANYSGRGAVTVQAPSGRVVIVPTAEYEALRNNCINGTLSSQEYHFRKDVLQLSSSIDEFGTIQMTVAVCIACSWFLVFFSVYKGPHSLSKAATGSVYTAFMLLSALCTASLVQEGSFLGLLECFKPDLWKLVDIKTWHSASRHLFYSLGLSYGATTCLASYSDFQANLLEHAAKVCLLDLAYCLMGALFVFGLYGNLAHSSHIEIGDLITQGISYTFVGFPETTSSRYLQRLWCFPFYLMVFVVTFGSETCLVGGFLGSLKDNYPALRSRPTLTAVLACVAGFALAVPFTFQGGLYLIELFDGIVYGDLIPWMGIAEVLSIAYGYGCDRLRNDIYFMFEKHPPWFLPFCWRYVCPLVLAVIGVNTFMLGESREFRYQRMIPEWTGMGQLIIMAAMMVIVGSFVISTLATNKYDLYAALEPEATYGPRGRAEFMRYQMYLADRNALPCSMSPESRRDVLDVPTSPAPSARQRASPGGANGAASTTAVSDKPKIVVVSSTGIVEASGSSLLGAGAVVVESGASVAASPVRKAKKRTRK
ncbi:sodium- and chloride-dependent betaine transporter-like [Dermacentor andersoni]|uniref:sodium- and chloride-dependent betaine transporter-like n=1 Tax=Dermacentor andersoni TaxID=34620 RepID=UPI003B3BE73A